MAIRDVTLSDIDQLGADVEAVDVVFEMDEETFRAFYERTARSVWSYLSRLTGDPQSADDLLQETYYRFLRAHGRWESEAHRRSYLFRIATNLARDRHRRAVAAPTVPLGDRDVASERAVLVGHPRRPQSRHGQASTPRASAALARLRCRAAPHRNRGRPGGQDRQRQAVALPGSTQAGQSSGRLRPASFKGTRP